MIHGYEEGSWKIALDAAGYPSSSPVPACSGSTQARRRAETPDDQASDTKARGFTGRITAICCSDFCSDGRYALIGSEARDLERQLAQGAPATPSGMARTRAAGRGLPAGNQDRGRQFSLQELRQAGYQALFAGQKTYNGVAILSRVAAVGSD